MNKVLTILFLSFIFLAACKNEPDAKSEITETRKEDLQAVKTLEEQLKQSPDSPQLRMRLISTYDSLGMYAPALSLVDSMIKRDSANNGLWFTKAQLLESNGDTTNALKSYDRALRIYPSVETQLSYANLLAETRNKQSLSILANIAKMGLGREMDAHCDFIAGVYNARTANYPVALSLFDRSINNNYTYMEAYMEKGFIYFDTKKYEEALKVFDKAITVQNTYADAWYWKAKTLEALGQKEDAVAHYQKAVSLDKNLKEAKEAIERLK